MTIVLAAPLLLLATIASPEHASRTFVGAVCGVAHMPAGATGDRSRLPAFVLLSSTQHGLRLKKTKLEFVTDPDGIADTVVSRDIQKNDCVLGFQGIELSEGSLEHAKVFDSETGDIRARPMELRDGNLPSVLLKWHCPVAPKRPHRMCWIRIYSANLSQYVRPDGVGLFGFGWTDFTAVTIGFAGDLNRDGRLDFVVDWSTRGGAYCSGTTLFLSDRSARDRVVTVAATDSWCD